MANFKESFKKVVLTEGGYVNDPDDAGGETYLGISRRAHPYAKMWKTIDDIKKQYGIKNITNRLKQINSITLEVENIYKSKYWDILSLDVIPSQKIAHQLFDDAVNRGMTAAIRVAQHVVGMSVTGKITNELIVNLKQYGKS